MESGKRRGVGVCMVVVVGGSPDSVGGACRAGLSPV